MKTLLWVILPYVSLAIFVVGHFWRYRYDKFGWTTRSTQLYESRLLRIGSPLFHFGTFFAIMGHVMGLLLPRQAHRRRGGLTQGVPAPATYRPAPPPVLCFHMFLVLLLLLVVVPLAELWAIIAVSPASAIPSSRI